MIDFQDNPFTIEGNHWWKGALATFIISADIIMIIEGLVLVEK